jgi:hypothetical protein
MLALVIVLVDSGVLDRGQRLLHASGSTTTSRIREEVDDELTVDHAMARGVGRPR